MGFGENMHTQQQKKTTPNIKNTTKAPTVIDPTCFPGLGVGVAAAVDVVAEIVERTDEMRVVGVGVDIVVNPAAKGDKASGSCWPTQNTLRFINAEREGM